MSDWRDGLEPYLGKVKTTIQNILEYLSDKQFGMVIINQNPEYLELERKAIEARREMIENNPYLMDITRNVWEIVRPHLMDLRYGRLRAGELGAEDAFPFYDPDNNTIMWRYDYEHGGTSSASIGFSLDINTNKFFIEVAGGRMEFSRATDVLNAFQGQVLKIPEIRQLNYQELARERYSEKMTLGRFINSLERAIDVTISRKEFQCVIAYSRKLWNGE